MSFKMMEAKYAGACEGCGGQINPGDQIAWSRNDGTYHAGCKPSGNPAADREYWQGAAEANLWMTERRIYGDELADAWEMERELREDW